MLSRHSDKLRKVSTLIFGVVLLILSAVVLIGWMVHIEYLVTVFPGLVTMKANTALGLGISGVILILYDTPLFITWRTRLIYILSAMLVLLGSISLSEYFISWKPGLDELLIRDTIPSVGTSAPGQMAPLTALCFILSGVAFTVANRRLETTTRLPTVTALGSCVLLIGIVGTFGQIANVFHFEFWNFSGLAMHTAIGFIMVGMGLLSIGPGKFEWQIDPYTRIGYGTAIMMMLFVTGVSWDSTDDLVKAGDALSQARAAFNQIDHIRFQTAANSMAKNMNSSGEVIRDNGQEILLNLDLLNESVKADPHQQEYLNKLTPLLKQVVSKVDSSRESDPLLAKEINDILDAMKSDQLAKTAALQKRLDSISTMTFLLLPLGVFLCITALSISFFFLNERVLQQKIVEEKLIESENQFRTMANAIPQLAWIAEPDGNIFWYNERWYQYTGTTLEQMGGWGWQAVHDPRTLSEVMENWKSALKTGKPFEMEFPLRAASGEFRWFLTRVVPNRNAKGEIVRWFGTNTDVTSQRRAAEEIQMLNESLEKRVLDRTADLEAANKELEAFSYSVSHDLRAPIRTIAGFSQAVIEDCGPILPDEGKRFLLKIQEGSSRMGRLIDDLLAFSKAGRQKLTSARIDTNLVVNRVIEELYPSKLNPHTKIMIENLASCEGDVALITQVWVNLIANALKYSSKKEHPIIEIGSKDHVYFIRDNGAGFDMRYAETLFGVFQRLHRQDQFDGTGVGLAIVQRIVHRHQGRIWAEAAVEQGATFYFTLNESVALEAKAA